MQLSKFTDYSFRALIYLGKNRGKRCTVYELSEALKTSPHHMKKVVLKLAANGYILSTKGRHGGLMLSREPESIRLREVLCLTEENLNIFECYDSACACPLGRCRCKLKKISIQALHRFLEEFENYTLKDIL